MISQSFLLCASLSTDRQAVTSFCSTQHMGDSAFLWFENAETQGKVSVACAPRRWTGFMSALQVPCCKGSHSSWLFMRPEMEHHLGVARMDPLEACLHGQASPGAIWALNGGLRPNSGTPGQVVWAQKPPPSSRREEREGVCSLKWHPVLGQDRLRQRPQGCRGKPRSSCSSSSN